MNADIALKKLIEGNKHYVNATDNGAEIVTKLERSPADQDQTPFAIILGCSDSRVPVETVFHQGLGDLFVIRVAGNIVAPSQIGSIEFACHNFGTQLVVVLGHSNCGAVKATIDALTSDPAGISPNIASIVDRVAPAVLPVVAKNPDADKTVLLEQAVTANVNRSVLGLTSRSVILKELIDQGKLKIVGAEYSLETGQVEFHLPE